MSPARQARSDTAPQLFLPEQPSRRFLLLRQINDDWYKSLFPSPGRYRAYGENTPAEATVSEDTIRAISELAPSARIIFVLRDPIERVWSHYRYQIGKGLLDRNEVESALNDFFESRTFYDVTIERYEKWFDRRNILYLFYEDMVENPEGFVNNVCRFLGVSSFSNEIKVTLNERVNASIFSDCAIGVRQLLQDRFGYLIPYIQEKVGCVPASWLHE